MEAMDAKLDEIALLNLLRRRDEIDFNQFVEQYFMLFVRLIFFIREQAVAKLGWPLCRNSEAVE
jgi:hypothetical protein